MDKRIIEVGGVKLEVDMRYARTVESYRVGDNVKVLIKTYGDTFESHAGVIVGFDSFAARPTIVIAYVKTDYASADIKFLYLNKDTKDVEICPMIGDELIIDKQRVVDLLDKGIASKQKELDELNIKKAYFLTNFERAFGEL